MSEPAYKYLHTSKVDPKESAAQMMSILARIGANRVSMEMGPDGLATGMTFETVLGPQMVQYRMPVKWQPIFDCMLKEAKAGRSWFRGPKNIAQKTKEIEDQAKRTAWRLALDWLKIQSAFVHNGVRHPAEVFLADMVFTRDGATTTVGECLLKDGGIARLTHGSSP